MGTTIRWIIFFMLIGCLLGVGACDDSSNTPPIGSDGDTDTDTDSDADSDSELDTGQDTFEEVDTENWEETNFESRCVNYCDLIVNCDYDHPSGQPYTEFVSWFTTEEECPADCTADFNDAKTSIITDCENYLFQLYSCEMALNCEDWIRYQLMTEEVDTLPCGSEIQTIIDNACWGG